jgi:hypothetical protein
VLFAPDDPDFARYRAEPMDDLFFVELPNGQQKAMTLDELDAAYQAGAIDESTRVRPDEGEWSTLGDLLGGTEEIPDAPPITHPESLAPVAIHSPAAYAPTVNAQIPDLYDLDDEAQLKPSKKKFVFGALGAGAVVAVLAVVGITKLGGAGVVADTATKAAAAAAPPPAAVDPQPAETSTAPKLTDEQKKLLADQDKKRADADAKKRAERAEREAAKPHHGGGHRTKSSEPFVKGGSKYDPLNGSL